MTRKKPLTEFEALQKTWYDKLKANGFEDAESSERHLKFWNTGRLANHDHHVLDNAREYYILAEHFLNDHKFDSELQKVIWEYHANGMSARDIAKILNKVKATKTNRTSVWIIIKDLRAKMKFLYRVYSNDDQPN